MTHYRGSHIRGLYAVLNFLHTPSMPKPVVSRVCYCSKKKLGLHRLDCAERLTELEDTSHTLPMLKSSWDMGWNLEELPPSFTLNAKAGLAYTMGRDYRTEYIEDDLQPNAAAPAVFASM